MFVSVTYFIPNLDKYLLIYIIMEVTTSGMVNPTRVTIPIFRVYTFKDTYDIIGFAMDCIILAIMVYLLIDQIIIRALVQAYK